MITMRDYQDQAVSAVEDAFARGLQRVAVVLPTGSGKTVIFAYLAARWAAQDKRVTILVDRDELVSQTLDKLAVLAPIKKAGVIKAERDDVDYPITVASVQTLARTERMDRYHDALLSSAGRPNLIIVDECDLATSPSYRRVMAELGCYSGLNFTLGVTATMKRADGARLGAVWQEVVFERDILSMIPKYLVDVTGRLITVDGMSLAQVGVRAGDFTPSSLTDILVSSGAAEIAAKGYAEHAGKRPGIVFVPSLAASEIFQDAFGDHGIAADRVWGTQNHYDRRGIVGRFRDNLPGAPQVLINCMALTRGFDAPRAEVIMIARPTLSEVLYQQMVGRGLRPFPGKLAALVLDLAGASLDHRLASLTDLSGRRIREVKPGESLTEAATRERTERNLLLADYVVDYRDIDLFRASRASWLQTPMGVWFLRAGDQMLFLWPGEGDDSYRIGQRALRARAGGKFLAKGLTLDWAMAEAESHAEKIVADLDTDADLLSVKASWRAKKARPRLLGLAQSLGVSTAGNAGQISDRVSIELARRSLDANFTGQRS